MEIIMINFSCADFSFPVLRHDKVLKLLELMDFDRVDIGLFTDRSHLQPADQLDIPAKRGRELKMRAGNCGLKISDVFLQSALDFKERAINHPNKTVRSEERELFLRLVEYTAEAGCNHITGLPGVDFGEDSGNICIEEMSWRLEEANKNGITYAVEPHFGSIMEDPNRAVKLLEQVQGMSVTLDHSHYTAQGIGVDEVEILVPYASHLHARGAAKNEMQTSAARNTTDFLKVIEQLKKHGYSGTICMEYCYIDWENCNRTDNVSETILLREQLYKLLI
jgi:sugar phosphate isomerase/epimerase